MSDKCATAESRLQSLAPKAVGLSDHANSNHIFLFDNIERRSVSESNQASCRATLLMPTATRRRLLCQLRIKCVPQENTLQQLYRPSKNPERKSTSSAHPQKRWSWDPHRAISQTSGGFVPRPYSWVDISPVLVITSILLSVSR